MIQPQTQTGNNAQVNVNDSSETRIWLKKYYSTPIDEIQQILLATGYSITKTLEILRQREHQPEFAQ
jgi:intergrase/recombinase